MVKVVWTESSLADLKNKNAYRYFFEMDRIFHVHNQGNNRNKTFLEKRNYVFFLEKMRIHVLPYTDFLAWCLMPNHFHLMIYIKETELPLRVYKKNPKTRSL